MRGPEDAPVSWDVRGPACYRRNVDHFVFVSFCCRSFKSSAYEPSKKRSCIGLVVSTAVGEARAPVSSNFMYGNVCGSAPAGVKAKLSDAQPALFVVVAGGVGAGKEISVRRLIPVGKTFHGVSWTFAFVGSTSSSKMATE